jgi:DNA-binding IclR family transcriptional regulator
MLTADQAAVLRHLVRIEPTVHNAREVSRHLGLNLPTAVRCLQELRRLGYARYGPDSLGARPEDAEHVPTERGKASLRSPP